MEDRRRPAQAVGDDRILEHEVGSQHPHAGRDGGRAAIDRDDLLAVAGEGLDEVGAEEPAAPVDHECHAGRADCRITGT